MSLGSSWATLRVPGQPGPNNKTLFQKFQNQNEHLPNPDKQCKLNKAKQKVRRKNESTYKASSKAQASWASTKLPLGLSEAKFPTTSDTKWSEIPIKSSRSQNMQFVLFAASPANFASSFQIWVGH